jgi:tetratricopeptide (TPR) repeat protein
MPEPENSPREVPTESIQLPLAPTRLRDIIIVVLVVLAIIGCVIGQVVNFFLHSDLWTFLYFALGLLGFLAVCVGYGLFQQGFFTWMRLARAPARAMRRGDRAAAESAYLKALARARQFGAHDRRRALMLIELSCYLMYQGRSNEATALAQECVDILSAHHRKSPDAYLVALKNLAVFLIDAKEYETAQRVLDRAIDETLILKKPAEKEPINTVVVEIGPKKTQITASIQRELAPLAEWDFYLHWVVTYLLIEANRLPESQQAFQYASELHERLDGKKRAALNDHHFLLRAHWLCAIGDFEQAGQMIAKARPGPEDPLFVRVQARIEIARGNHAAAEQVLHPFLELQRSMGTTHRPDLLPHALALAESLFGQGKHDEAFAAFQDARGIVADFALPADAAWQKTLQTWLQRAKDLGRTDLAASLEAELQKIPANVNQAITILEKLRIQAPAE